MRESTFTFWEDTDFNALPDKTLTAADYAYQARTEEEESWTGEVSGSDGTYVQVFFAVYRDRGQARLLLAKPGQEVIIKDIAAPFQAATDRLDVEIGGNCIYQEGNRFLLRWQGEDLGLELELRPLLPGWQPGAGRINYGEKGDKYLDWSVPVPRATVSGNLFCKGHREALSGTGYIDHRCYNFPLPWTLAHATLGRYYTDQYTLVWADFQGNLLYSGKHITALYLARQGETLATTGNLEIQVLDWQGQAELDYPSELSLQAATTPLLRLDIKEVTPLGSRLVTELGSQGLYCRFNGQLKLATQPESALTGHGFLETLQAKG